MFTDDRIIFYGETKQVERDVKYIMDHYYKVSSQLVNYHKSTTRFSKGINNVERKESLDILQITAINTIGTYLECPNIDKKLPKANFKDSKRRIGQKRPSWKA